MPKVSVIIPNYNHAPFLRQRIESVLAQTLPDLEVILMDDASTDDSRSVMEPYRADPRVRLVCNEKNSGSPFRQWNKGVDLAHAGLIWIAESDDFAAPGFLARMTGLLDARPAVGLAYCRTELVDIDSRPVGQRLPGGNPRWDRDFVQNGPRECARDLALSNTVPNASAVVFRRQLYLDAGGADDSFQLLGDWMTWARLFLRGDVAYVAEPLAFYRRHARSVRASYDWDSEWPIEHRRMVTRLAAEPDFPARAFWFGYYSGLAYMHIRQGRRARALAQALRAVITSPARPYAWRLAAWSALGPWGTRWLDIKNQSPGAK